jgi:hypothetical protein
MRARFLAGLLVVAGLGQAAVASASVLIDDFNGSTVNAGIWTVALGAPTVSGSALHLASTATSTDVITSVATYDTGIEFKVATAPTGHAYFGVRTTDGFSKVLIRNDGDDSPVYHAVLWNDGADNQVSSGFSVSAGDVFALNYGTSGASLYKNQSLIWSETDLGLRNASAEVFLGLSSNSVAPNGTVSSIGIDSVSHVPEPGTILLLATGLIGLLAYAWRKHK